MPQKYYRLSIGFVCTFFSYAAIILCFGASSLRAQVPAPQRTVNLADVKSGDRVLSHELIAHTFAAIVTIPSGAAEIPFGTGSNPKALAVLDMKGYEQEFIRTFTFKNTSSATYTINSIDFEKQDDIFELSSIVPGGTLPMDVAPGEIFSVRISYHGFERNELRSNILRFHTEGKAMPLIFPIQAIQEPLSAMLWNKKIAAANVK